MTFHALPNFRSRTTGRRTTCRATQITRSRAPSSNEGEIGVVAPIGGDARCHRAGLITGGDFESGRSRGGRIGSRDCLAAELGLVSPNTHSPDCTAPRIKGWGWSAQPEVARERFDIDRGGLQQAGDRQERDGRRIASRGRAPDDPGLSPGSLRHHRPEHLTVALEAVRVEQQMEPARPLAGIRPAHTGRVRWIRRLRWTRGGRRERRPGKHREGQIPLPRRRPGDVPVVEPDQPLAVHDRVIGRRILMADNQPGRMTPPMNHGRSASLSGPASADSILRRSYPAAWLS